MKKIKYLLSIIILTIALVCISNSNSKAVFYIEKFDIQAQVKENGDMQITENIKYYSTETKNGVTREIQTTNEFNKNNSASGLLLEEVLIDNIPAKKVMSATLGKDGVYVYNKSGDEHSIKVYMPFSSKTRNRTVTYKYTLRNVAVQYNDIAEVFWNFIGDQWDTSIKNVHIKLILPDAAKKDTIYVYGHGSDNGKFEKTNNVIDLYAYDLDANQALDARILFSKLAIPSCNKIVNKSVLNQYIHQEEGISKNYDEPKIIWNLSVKQIAITLSILIILLGIYIYIKYDKEFKVEKSKYYREIPYDLSPEILQTVYFRGVQNNAFFITFLNLVKKGVYKITKITNKVGKETQLITYTGKEDIQLESYEYDVKNCINGFFSGKDNSIDLLELKQRMKKGSTYVYRNYKSNLESKVKGLFGEKTKLHSKVKVFLTIAMIVLILLILMIASKQSIIFLFPIAMFLGMTTTIYTIFFSKITFNVATIMFLIFHCGMFQMANITLLRTVGAGLMYIPYILMFILLQYSYRIEKSSKEERQVLQQIKGLRRYIKDYSYLSKREDIGNLNLWEDYFILSIALKLNNKTVDYFYDYCTNNLSDNFGESLGGFTSYTMMSATMASSFNTYVRSSSYVRSYSGGSSSSYSGSSGGFSGGSSSGGGGRRRWRRKLILIK